MFRSLSPNNKKTSLRLCASHDMAGLGAGIRSIQLISLQHVTRNKMITSGIQDAGGEPAAVLFEIRETLCERLGVPLDTRFSIQDLRRHRHSRSMILQSDALRDRIFVKFGAHFSGGHEWDVKSEYQGYLAIQGMELYPERFFSIRPILYREAPHILATVFAEDAAPLKTVYERGLRLLMPSVSPADVNRFTRQTATWLKRFMAVQEKNSGRVSPADLTGFCQKRWEETLAWGDAMCDPRMGRRAMTEYLSALFGSDAGGEAQVTRNHGDFGPHNVLVDRDGRIGVIDVGFGLDGGYPLAYEDAATFLIYLEEMRNNPMYRPWVLEGIIRAFLDSLFESPYRFRLFMPAYVKKVLAHAAWCYHPQRRHGSRWREFSFRRWTTGRLSWLQQEIGSLRRPEAEMIYERLYGFSA
jgi:hypothetical protein